MGIVRIKKETVAIHRKGHSTMEVWRFIGGAWRSVWQYIRSCFGKGFWVNGMPWRNTDGWKNF